MKSAELHVNRIRNELRRRILAGEIGPEVSLRQEEIAEQFGVSRTPAREALKALESEGLVENIRHAGFKTRKYSLRQIIEIMDVRGLLEGHAARLAASIRDPALTARLYQIAEELHRATDGYYQSGDSESYLETTSLERDFHLEIITASRNSVLLELYTSGQLQFFPSQNVASGRRHRGTPTHRDLADAIASGDPDLAERTARRHVSYKTDTLLEKLGPIAVFRDQEREAAADETRNDNGHEPK